MFYSKGDFQYSKKHMIFTGILMTFMLVLSFGIYFLGIHLYGSNKNLLTLIAVLGMLPAGKEVLSFIMCIKAYKYGCSKEDYKAIESIIKDSKPEVRYDFYITSYENSFPIYALTCFDNSIIGYAASDKFKYDKFNEHVNTILSENGMKASVIKIFNNREKFLERIEVFSKSSSETSENDYKLLKLMENISL